MLGSRESERSGLVDFNRKYAVVPVNTAAIKGGIALEEIAPGVNGLYPAISLMQRGWNTMYFVNQRPDFSDEDYFKLAARRFREQGIAKP